MSRNITKAEIIRKAAEVTGLPMSKTEQIVNLLLDNITDNLKDQKKVTLMGFGCFSTINRQPRKGVDPRTGHHIMIPAKTTPKFKAGKLLANHLNMMN